MSTDQIILLGSDQLESEYDLSFPDGIPTGGKASDVALRCDMTFQVPEQSVGTYDIYKKGVKVTKTNMVTGTTKIFQIEWRIDQDWETFDAMKKWVDAVYDPITGTALPDATIRATVLCTPCDTQNNVKKKIRFKNCKPYTWQLTPFGNESANPLRCTMTFVYVDLIVENV